MTKILLAQANNRFYLPIVSNSVHCVVTSPPYFNARDYLTAEWIGGDPECSHSPGSLSRVGPSALTGGKKTAGHQHEVYRSSVCPRCGAKRSDAQLGRERQPDCLGWATGKICGECYVCHTLAWTGEVMRILRPDGVFFLNIGDNFAGSGQGWGHNNSKTRAPTDRPPGYNAPGWNSKNLYLIPERLALALQAQGWYVRQRNIWYKINPMPESVNDRPTTDHTDLDALQIRPVFLG